jgi:hypothetical protein
LALPELWNVSIMNVDAAATFLSASFHRDTQADSIRDVVRSFVSSEEGQESAWMIASQLDLIADQRIYATDDEWLKRVYGCGYLPSQIGLSGSNWVRAVAQMMKEGLSG